MAGDAENTSRGALAASAYLDPALLARELETCFHRRWTYVALRTEVAAHNDYVVRQVGAKSVFVQNIRGELRAFTNVCPHRFAELRPQPCGNGAIQCPYHRWTFDADGQLTGMPLAAEFHGARNLAGAWTPRLERWRVTTVGELVFVTLAIDCPDLVTALGPDAERLSTLTSAFDQPIVRSEHLLRANWKIILQNTLDFYHVASVHPDTFGPFVPKQPRLEVRTATAPNLSYVSHLEPGTAGRRSVRGRGVSASVDRLYARRPVNDLPGYFHYLSFPNATIGTTDGRSLAVFRYTPRTVDTTVLEIQLISSRVPTATPYERELVEWSWDAMIAVALRISSEDQAICESVQRAATSTPRHWSGWLGDGERIVRAFQHHYLDVMGAAAPPGAIDDQ